MSPPSGSDLEMATAALASDSDGKLIATQLLAQILAGKEVNHLVQEFWQKPAVAIKSLRAGIEALASVNFDRLPRANTRLCLLAVLYYIRAILTEKRHCEHLNGREWSHLWAAVNSVFQRDDSLQVWSTACACWSALLDITTAIPSDLEVYAADLLDLEVTNELEQAYDAGLMACLRKLYQHLSELGTTDFCEDLVSMGVSLFASRARVKNAQLVLEAAQFFVNISSAHGDQFDDMIRNFKPYAPIPAEDVVFTESGITLRQGALELPWLVSYTLARLSTEGPRAAKKPCLESDFDAQISCFSHTRIPLTCSFWGFVAAGLTVDNLASEELVKILGVAIQNVYRNSSAAFTIAKILQSLTKRDEQAGPALSLINTWLANLGRLELSAASVYLFCTLKTLRIVDIQFHELLGLANSWLEHQLLHNLQNGFVPLAITKRLVDFLPELNLNIIPTKQSYCSYLALCVLTDHTPRTGILTRLLKEDIRDFIDLAQFLEAKSKNWDPDEILKLAQESELDTRALEYTLTRAEPTPEGLSEAPTIKKVTETKFKEIVSGVFAKYELNRSPPRLCKIMEMMSAVPRGKPVQELTHYLLKVVSEQSKLSPLRPSLAAVTHKASDWKVLIETSTSTSALKMLDTFVPDEDFCELLSCNIDWWPSLLAKLSTNERQISSIVCRLLLHDKTEYLEAIAVNLKTTKRQLFRSIGSKLMFAWSMEKPALEFPFHKFDCEPSVGQKYCPIGMLPLEWIENPDMFASFAVMSMRDKLVEQRLQEVYTAAQLKAQLRKFHAQIMLKLWSTVRINHPRQYDVWLDHIPSDKIPDSGTACWIMEQLVLAVMQFRHEDIELALAQVWNVYKSTQTTETTVAVVRCMLALSELAEVNIAPFLCQITPPDGSIALEVAAHSPRLFTTTLSKWKLPSTALGKTVNSIVRGESIYPIVAAAAVHELRHFEFPFYIAKLLLDHIIPDAQLAQSDPELLAPLIKRWTLVFKKDGKWLEWANRLESSFGPFVHQRKYDARSSQLETIRDHCQESPYFLRFAVNPFVHKVLQDTPYVEHSFSELYTTGVDLCEKDAGQSEQLQDHYADVQQFSEQLFEEFTACSLTRAFQLRPQLAQEVVAFEIAVACESNKSLNQIRGIIKPNISSMGELVLKIVAEAYYAGYLLIDPEDALPLCIEQGQFELGLMFAELSWSETGERPQLLRDIVRLSRDEDINSIVPSELSLTAIKLSSWEQLSFSLAEGSKKASASTLRAHGIFDLANSLEKHSFYDYQSAWMLQQWELPECLEPQTEEQVLFNLFRAKDLDFGRAFLAGPNSNLLEIENIRGPGSRPNNNVRQASELILKRSERFEELALDLAYNHATFCLQQNKEQAVAYARKLEQMAGLGYTSVSQVATAKTAWLLGDQVLSIEMLEQVAEALPAALIDSAHVLCTLTQWSDETKHTSELRMMENYLYPAVEYATKSKSLESMAATFHTFAAYCDSKYTDPALSNEIHQAKRMRDEHRSNIEMYRKGLQLNRDDKKLYSKIKLAQQQSTTEQNEYAKLKGRLRTYLDMSIKHYLKSLAVGGGEFQLNDSCRFIALWFSQPEASLAMVKKYLPQVPSYIFALWVNQLTSKLGSESEGFQLILETLVVRVGNEHPHHLLWPLYSVMLGEDQPRKNSAKKTWMAISNGCKTGVNDLASHMIAVAQHRVKPEEKKSFSFNKIKSEQKWWQSLKKLRLVCPASAIPIRPDCNYDSLPRMESVSAQIAIANGLSAPKIVNYTTSDGSKCTMLLKGGNDDLRQDAIMEQVFGHVNSFLSHDSRASRRKLLARTYAVVPLGANAGVIEFVPNTKSLHDILDPMHNENAGRGAWSRAKARQAMHAAYEYGKEARIQAYQEITQHIKPVMRKFFFQKYRSAQEWLEKRTVFARSAATMSIVGHILGLGDRHCNNILVDISSGHIVHIDLGIAFDQGKYLRIPETVPFRLTRDIVDGMGIAGVEGPFKVCAEITLQLLLNEQKQISTVLEVLRYDPLYSWNASELRQKLAQGDNTTTTLSIDAEQALLGVKRKLSGHLNVMANVCDLVHQATSETNLALIFEGWTPFY